MAGLYEIIPPDAPEQKDGGGLYEVIPPERTFTEKLGHQAGLAVRQGVEGVMGATAGVFIDPWTRLARDLYSEYGPKKVSDLVAPPRKFPTTMEETTRILDYLGLPKEETGAEEVVGSINRAVAGGGGTLGLMKLAAAAPELATQFFMRGATPEIAGATQVPRVYNPALTTPSQLPSGGVRNVPQVAAPSALVSNPLAQGIQMAIGGGSAEGVRQAGGGELAQLVASAIAPLGVTTGVNVARAAGRGVAELVRPVTMGGAKQVAADVLGQLPTDKSAAISKLDAYIASLERDPNAVGVPGSKPTAGAVAKDYGLIGGEQVASREAAAPEFSARFAENNAARLDMLARLRATREQLAAFEAKRDAITKPLREDAFAGATGNVDFDPVVVKILNETAKPAGGRAETEKALKWVTQRVGRYLEEGRLSADHAYELYKDIGDLVAGKIKQEGSSLQLAAGIANSIKQELGLQIEKVAPGFRKYLDTYSRLSKPIERLEVLTDALGGRNLEKVVNSLPMATERGGVQQQLSQDKMRGAVKNIQSELAQRDYRGAPLAPRQQDILSRVVEDLTSQELGTRGGKRPGSDTYQNMATSNILTAIFGKQLAEAGLPKAVVSPLNFVANKTGLEARIRDLVDQAYLDPKLMAELLKMSRTQRSVSLSDIANTANQNIYGGLIGGAAQ